MYKKIIKDINPNENIEELLQLHKQPSSENRLNTPTFQNFIPNYTHQADLLSLPTAKYGYKYLLVVVDTHTRKFDAYPLKNASSTSVLNAFKKIYESSKYLKLPKRLEFDAGSAFHGLVEDYFTSLGIKIRYAETNRHRQQSLVESKNQLLGNVIFHLLNMKELHDRKLGIKKSATDWYKTKEDFNSLIDTINEHQNYKPLTKETQPTPISTKENRELLNVGDKVRIKLDYPIDIAHKKKLIGKFRSADIKWSLEIHTIEHVILKPGQPPLYKVNDMDALRTIQQLLLVQQN